MPTYYILQTIRTQGHSVHTPYLDDIYSVTTAHPIDYFGRASDDGVVTVECYATQTIRSHGQYASRALAEDALRRILGVSELSRHALVGETSVYSGMRTDVRYIPAQDLLAEMPFDRLTTETDVADLAEDLLGTAELHGIVVTGDIVPILAALQAELRSQ